MVTKYHGFVILDRVLHWQLEIQSVAFPASNFPFLSDTVDISGNFRLGSAFGYCLVLKLTLFHNHDEWRRTCLVTALSKIIIASYFSVRRRAIFWWRQWASIHFYHDSFPMNVSF